MTEPITVTVEQKPTLDKLLGQFKGRGEELMGFLLRREMFLHPKYKPLYGMSPSDIMKAFYVGYTSPQWSEYLLALEVRFLQKELDFLNAQVGDMDREIRDTRHMLSGVQLAINILEVKLPDLDEKP